MVSLHQDLAHVAALGIGHVERNGHHYVRGLAHVANKEIGHGSEFWKNFKFLLVNAKEIGIYIPEDYKKKQVSYCGMQISDNPYFDLA